MLHHISLPVADLNASAALYDAMLAALGFRRVVTVDTAVGNGQEIGQDRLLLVWNPSASAASEGFHLAMAAPSRAAVEDFYKAAPEHGATDNGKPGLRAHYSPDYYAAFVIDLDGHRLEAVYK
ncbi:MAG: VOC family protein [Pseudomonadota bacterium]